MGRNKCAYPKLKGRIIEVCQSQTTFAAELNMSRTTLSKKMTKNSEWTLPEISKACTILGIDRSEAGDYFLI